MIKRPLAALRRWLRYRRNLYALATLDDHILHDIGLRRVDLVREAKRVSC